jgi:hypothetical protein
LQLETQAWAGAGVTASDAVSAMAQTNDVTFFMFSPFGRIVLILLAPFL